MPLQIVTGTFALLFAAVLVLNSYRYVDSRAVLPRPMVLAHAVR